MRRLVQRYLRHLRVRSKTEDRIEKLLACLFAHQVKTPETRGALKAGPTQIDEELMKKEKMPTNLTVMQPRTIWLKQNDSYIRIIDSCDSHSNVGLITSVQNAPVWLSLKSKEARSPRHLIGEIEKAGGDFCKETGYSASERGNAIRDGGTGYQGGIQFSNLEDSFSYLAQYFDVRWCDAPPESENKFTQEKSPSGSPTDAASVSSSSLSEVASHLATLLSHRKPTQEEFSRFYEELNKCCPSVEVKGADAHLETSWPRRPGVYVVHDLRVNDLYGQILYVGMTGKLTRVGSEMKGRLKFRPRRWDPYCFMEVGFFYGYKRKDNAYQHDVDAKNYKVVCFEFDEKGLSAPSFLEALILQAYAVAGPNRLPPANNAF